MDAQLAEELAQRYSDFKHKEVSSYEGHGGYLQNGQVTRGCMDKMFGEIERAHGGIELLGVWATVAEMIRVGNDHIGASLAAKSPWFNPWARHFGELVIAGSVVFLTIAWLRGAKWKDKAPQARGPQPITLH